VSLYNPHIATMEADPTKAYNQDDATGFIRLNALRLKVAAKVHGNKLDVPVERSAKIESRKMIDPLAPGSRKFDFDL
jgi:argininosuccinate synthase